MPSSTIAGFEFVRKNGGAFAHVAVASEMLQQFDFAQCAFGENLLAEDIGDLLDGDPFIRLVVDSRTIVEDLESAIVVMASRQWVWRGKLADKPAASSSAAHVPDNTISSLTKFLGDCVPLVHNKVLVEDLEDLTSLQVGHDVYSIVAVSNKPALCCSSGWEICDKDVSSDLA